MPHLELEGAVTAIPAAAPALAQSHFEHLLSVETDCWDVHAALKTGEPGFVLLDVRSPELFAAGQVPSAVNLPYRRISLRSLERFPEETLFVVYCSGPHCNGADKAAVRLAQLGRPVKKMIGGIAGWKTEGFVLTTSVAARKMDAPQTLSALASEPAGAQ
jgi:rhodanese-related sulfurtransferase